MQNRKRLSAKRWVRRNFACSDISTGSLGTTEMMLGDSKTNHLVKSAAPAVFVAVKTPSLVTLYFAEP